MKLRSIQVENYRSIGKTQSLQLDAGLTVILGPNNEGKSNLLRALVLAMGCLRSMRLPTPPAPPSKAEPHFRLIRGVYDWEADFPRKLQALRPDGETVLTLEFSLSDDERRAFKVECGSAINGNLPLEIRVGSLGATFKVRKPGRGAKAYAKKSRQIALFISSTFDFQYIPAIRPSQLSLEVVGSLIERELSLLSADEAYKSALQTIEDLQRPVFERLGNDVQAHLKQLLPSVKSVRIASSLVDRSQSRFRLPQFVVDDGTATELEAKGDGIKSLVAISLMRASKAGGAIGDLVVAIEEPESHLHPGAVRQLAVVLQELANEHQVIITTHSPLLVARNRMDANIIVSKSKATPASSIAAVRQSLGVQVDDNLTTAEVVLLVEGQTDVQALRAVFSARSQAFADLLSGGRLVFDYMEGTGNVAYKLSTLRLQVATPILLTDDDKAGRDCLKKAKSAGGLDEKFHFCWKRPKGVETELEDLFAPDLYWTSIQNEFGVVLDRAVFDASDGRWTMRMQAAFESAGKSWNSSLETNLKAHVAKLVSESPANSIAVDRAKLVDSVINGVVNVAQSGAPGL